MGHCQQDIANLGKLTGWKGANAGAAHWGPLATLRPPRRVKRRSMGCRYQATPATVGPLLVLTAVVGVAPVPTGPVLTWPLP